MPGDAQPRQGLVDQSLRIGNVARLIGVLDTQDKLAAVSLREGGVEKRHIRGADVRISGG